MIKWFFEIIRRLFHFGKHKGKLLIVNTVYKDIVLEQNIKTGTSQTALNPRAPFLSTWPSFFVQWNGHCSKKLSVMVQTNWSTYETATKLVKWSVRRIAGVSLTTNTRFLQPYPRPFWRVPLHQENNTTQSLTFNSTSWDAGAPSATNNKFWPFSFP